MTAPPATSKEGAPTHPPAGGWYVVIQRNPRAGRNRTGRHLRNLIDGLRRRGFRLRLFRRRERLTQWMSDPDRQQRLWCLVGAGGDGTICDLATRFPGTRLAVLPLGTENLLAKFLRIRRDGERLAQLIAAGRTRTLDLGRIGERRFVIMAGVGRDAEVVRRVHANRRGNITHGNYVWPILATVFGFTPPELRVRCDDGAELRGRQLILTNQPAFALGLQFAPEADGGDGLLDLRLFSSGGVRHTLRYLWAAWCGTVDRLPDVVRRQGRRFTIEAATPVPVQVDGDPCGTTPVEVSVVPHALQIITPGG